MSEEIESTIYTEDGARVYVSEWDDGGAWMRVSDGRGSMSAVMTRKEAEELFAGLQAILAKGVTA